MCIIISCDKNARVGEGFIEACWNGNPDGAGLMWSDGTRVYGSKGFMYISDFMREYESIPDDAPLILHFRIGTSGGFGPEVTHPYPVSSDLDCLHALDWSAPYGIAHNGVIPDAFVDETRGISDTISFVAGVVAPLSHDRSIRRGGGLASSGVAKSRLRDASVGSRLAIMDSGGNVSLIGRGWETVSPGVQASNGSWRYETYARTYARDRVRCSCDLPYSDCCWCELADDCAELGPLCMDGPDDMYRLF